MPLLIIKPSAENPVLGLKIVGRFDYSLHQDFRNSYTQQKAKVSLYQLDLSEAEYMDSSALGMLLLLKEFAEQRDASVTLLSPTPMVRKVLEIANFNQFFQIQ